jgi:hypothetical protein
MRRRDFIAGIGTAATWPWDIVLGQPTVEYAWLYETAEGPGAFQRSGGNRWVETTPLGTNSTFLEIAHAGDYVELYDPSRSLWLKLHDTYGEWRQDSSASWVRWLDGHWVTADNVPPLFDHRIRLAYLVAADRQPISNYEQKIRIVMHFVNELYRQSLAGSGVPSNDLPFQTHGGEPVVHLIRSTKRARDLNNYPSYDGIQHWNNVIPEIPKEVGVPDKHLIIAFS